MCTRRTRSVSPELTWRYEASGVPSRSLVGNAKPPYPGVGGAGLGEAGPAAGGSSNLAAAEARPRGARWRRPGGARASRWLGWRAGLQGVSAEGSGAEHLVPSSEPVRMCLDCTGAAADTSVWRSRPRPSIRGQHRLRRGDFSSLTRAVQEHARPQSPTGSCGAPQYTSIYLFGEIY